ncbi:hypothetical protein JCM8208_006167 [Rhodotorula glutinis]
MWPFHPTGTRQLFAALFKATRTASPRAARIARQAVRDKKRVEMDLERTMGPEWRKGAQGAAASAAEPTPSSTTSTTQTSPHPSSPPTSHTQPELASSPLKLPVARPLEMRPTLAGVARPQEERRERNPLLSATRNSAVEARRPSGPQGHIGPVWRSDTGRLPRLAAPKPAAALADGRPSEARRVKMIHDRNKGLYVARMSLSNERAPRRRTSGQLKISKPVEESQPIDVASNSASLKSNLLAARPALGPSPPPPNLPLELERALFASHPSSLSSVRLTDSIPRAHFARAFAAEREAKLAEKVLEMYPRGASSVDLGTAPTKSTVAGPRAPLQQPRATSKVNAEPRSSASSPSLEDQLFSSFPRGASSVDLGTPPVVPVTTARRTPKVPLRGVQSVGLEPSVPRTDLLEGVKRRTAQAVAEAPQVDAEGVRWMEQVRTEREGMREEARARSAREVVEVKASSPTTSSSLAAAHPSVVARPLAKPLSPLVEPNTPLSVLARRDVRSRDPREANYPVGLRKVFSASPFDRRIRLAALRASEDVELVQSVAEHERDIATEPAVDFARWIAEIREYRARLRRMRRLEDRCLDGEMARNEEQRIGRQLEALVDARVDLEGVVEAYRAYGEVGIVNFQLERALVDRLVKAQALLERALVLPGDPTPPITSLAGSSSSTASKAILWAGDRPFFVEFDAYIRTYRYGASRALKDLEVLRRRALRKIERVVDRVHMAAFEVEKTARA